MPPTTRSRAARRTTETPERREIAPETETTNHCDDTTCEMNPTNFTDLVTKVEKLNICPDPTHHKTSEVEELQTKLSGMAIQSPETEGRSMPDKNTSKNTHNGNFNSENDNSLLFDMASMKDELINISSTIRKPETSRMKKDSLSSLHTQRVPLPALSKKERASKLDDLTIQSLHLEHQYEANPKGVKAALLLCKLIQCLLWDADFRYTFLNYQYDAVLAAAGIDVKGLLHVLVNLDEAQRQLVVKQTKEGMHARFQLCKDSITFVQTKGLLLADAMGLGKTVMAIGAAVLRNYIFQNQRKSNVDKPSSLPSLVLAPSDAFLNQWESTLLTSGLPESCIVRFSRKMVLPHGGFVLITRHALMTEMRHVFKGEGSILFPTFPEEVMRHLNETRTSSGKMEEVTKTISSLAQLPQQHYFQSFIIDESHSLRNLTTYGAIGAALIGIATKRTIPISATPFIDSTQDIATLMVFIDPTIKAAYKIWWKEATRNYADDALVHEISYFRKHYIIRREREVLKNELTRKLVSVINVDCHDSELEVYKRYEDLFLKTVENVDPDLTVGKRELANVLLSYLINMRMSLIHPLIPKGREFTIRFSPSRRDMETKFSEKLCVCCSCDTTSGPLVPLPPSYCQASISPTPHFVHESCYKLLQHDNSGKCPRCRDFKMRAHLNPSETEPLYCKEINAAPGISGFQPTAKIKKVVEWVKSLPKGDKAIIYSFFEGSLDLLEGIFSELDIGCARLDNDTGPDMQAFDLIRFKTTPSCKLLLATVQSCGSGLNIEEANHIAFLDRWFDGSIHEQAQDRCHNLNQQKNVEVVYFDTSITVDNVMKAINDAMSVDATVTLADGAEIGTQQRAIRFKEITGPISKMIEAVVKERSRFTKECPGAKFSSCRKFLGRLTYTAEAKCKKEGKKMHSPQSSASNSPTRSEMKSPPSCPRNDNEKKQRRVAFAPLPNGHEKVYGHTPADHQFHTPRAVFRRMNAFHSQAPFDTTSAGLTSHRQVSVAMNIPNYYSSPHHSVSTPNQLHAAYANNNSVASPYAQAGYTSTSQIGQMSNYSTATNTGMYGHGRYYQSPMYMRQGNEYSYSPYGQRTPVENGQPTMQSSDNRNPFVYPSYHQMNNGDHFYSPGPYGKQGM